MGEEEAYLGSWKTKEEAEKGLANLQSKLGEHGNEIGTLKQQLMETQQALQQREKPPVEPVQSFDGKLNEVRTAMEDLVPGEPDYERLRQAEINLIAEKTKNEALALARKEFQDKLADMDSRNIQEKFLEQNPEFNAPDMQKLIQERIAADKTGMTDALVAFREIQRDQAAQEAEALKAKLEETLKLAKLEEGTQETGKIITAGSGGEKTSGKKGIAELKQGMLEALKALSP